MCVLCKRLDKRPDAALFACTAFPEGITEEVAMSGVDHRQPYPGDHVFQFERKDAAAAASAAELFRRAR